MVNFNPSSIVKELLVWTHLWGSRKYDAAVNTDADLYNCLAIYKQHYACHRSFLNIVNSVAVRTVHKGQNPVDEGEDNRASYKHVVDHAFGRPLRAVRSPRTLVVKKARPKSAAAKNMRNLGHFKKPGTAIVLPPTVFLPAPKGPTTISGKLQWGVNDKLPTTRLEDLRSMVLAKAKSDALLRAQDINKILPILQKKPKELQAEKSKWKRIVQMASAYKNDISSKCRHINQMKESEYSRLHATTDNRLNKEKLTQKLEEIGEVPVVESEPSTDMLHPSKDYRSAIFNRRSRVQEFKSRFDELAIKYLREATQKIDTELVKDMERLTLSYEAKVRAESDNAVDLNNRINMCNSVEDHQLYGTEDSPDAAKNIPSHENTTINLDKANSSLVPVPAQQHRVLTSDLVSENVDHEMEKNDIVSMQQQTSDEPRPLLPAQYKKYELNIVNPQPDVDIDADLDGDIQSLEQRVIRAAENESRLPERIEQDWDVLRRYHVLGSTNLNSKEELAKVKDKELPTYLKKPLTEWQKLTDETISKTQDIKTKEEEQETAAVASTPTEMAQSVIQTPLDKDQQSVDQAQHMSSVENDSSPCDQEEEKAKGDTVANAQSTEEKAQSNEQLVQDPDLIPTLSPAWCVSHREIPNKQELSNEKAKEEARSPDSWRVSHRDINGAITEFSLGEENLTLLQPPQTQPPHYFSEITLENSINNNIFYKNQDFGITKEKQETVGVTPTPIEMPQSYFEENVTLLQPPQTQPPHYFSEKTLENSINNNIFYKNLDFGIKKEKQETVGVAPTPKEMLQTYFEENLTWLQPPQTQPTHYFSGKTLENSITKNIFYKNQDFGIEGEKQETVASTPIEMAHSCLQAPYFPQDLSLHPWLSNKEILSDFQQKRPAFEIRSPEEIPERIVHASGLPVEQQGADQAQYLRSNQVTVGYWRQSNQVQESEDDAQSRVEMTKSIVQDHALSTDQQSTDQEQNWPSDINKSSQDHSALDDHALSKDNANLVLIENVNQQQSTEQAAIENKLSIREDFSDVIVKKELAAETSLSVDMGTNTTKAIPSPEQEPPPAQTSTDYLFLKDQEDKKEKKEEPAVLGQSPVIMAQSIIQEQPLPKDPQSNDQSRDLPSKKMTKFNYKELLFESQERKPAVVNPSPVETAQNVVQDQVLPEDNQNTHQTQYLPITQAIKYLPSDQIPKDNSLLPYNKKFLIESEEKKPAVVNLSPVETAQSVVQDQVLPEENQNTYQAQYLPMAQPIKYLPSDQISEENSSLPYNKQLLTESQEKTTAVVDASPLETAQSVVQAQVLPEEKQNTDQTQPLPIAQTIKNLPSDEISEDNSSLPYNREVLIKSQVKKTAVVDPSPLETAQSVVQAQVLPEKKQNTDQAQPLPTAEPIKNDDTELSESLPLMELLRRVRKRNRKARDSDDDKPPSP